MHVPLHTKETSSSFLLPPFFIFLLQNMSCFGGGFLDFTLLVMSHCCLSQMDDFAQVLHKS